MADDVRLIVLDVDGTLTDGTLCYDPATKHVLKRFHVADGLGIVMAQAVGIRVAVLTGRGDNPALEWRMGELGVTDIVFNAGDKAQAMRTLCAQYAVPPEQAAFVGDDINDLPAFDVAGVRIAVANAAPALKARASYVTERAGGSGGVRDAIEYILARQGQTDQAITAYLAAAQRAPRQ